MDAINMPITERDAYIHKIQQQIKEKEQFLLNTYKQIENLAKENEFLEDVKNDYYNYYNYIVQEKQSQINALEKINSHLNLFLVNTQLSADKIADIKQEQKQILSEINIINKSLTCLIENK